MDVGYIYTHSATSIYFKMAAINTRAGNLIKLGTEQLCLTHFCRFTHLTEIKYHIHNTAPSLSSQSPFSATQDNDE